MFKKNLKTFKTQYIILVIIFITSCIPDEDLEPETDDPRDKINYTWDCQENSPAYGEQAYKVDISKDPNDSTKVILSNFYFLGTDVTARAVYLGSTLTIYSQIVDEHSISGQGIVSSNYKMINWTYEVIELKKNGKDERPKESVTAIYTR